MYRLLTESLLGIHLEADKLQFKPCIPEEWKSYKIHYRYRETVYHITMIHASVPGINITVDNAAVKGNTVTLIDDRRDHYVDVEFNILLNQDYS
jgi:cellobiose phosphorylase